MFPISISEFTAFNGLSLPDCQVEPTDTIIMIMLEVQLIHIAQQHSCC